jgi:hypothetical protein
MMLRLRMGDDGSVQPELRVEPTFALRQGDAPVQGEISTDDEDEAGGQGSAEGSE